MAKIDYGKIERLKEQYTDSLLFVRIGDFYEAFGDDAVKISKELDLTLTSRDTAGAERVPMTGVPFHSFDGYIKKLVERGYKVAVAESLDGGFEVVLGNIAENLDGN
jgi:DNA mismatch repair protein MutS